MIQVEIGFWLTRDNKIVDIHEKVNGQWHWFSVTGKTYTDNGKVAMDLSTSEGDLIKRVAPEHDPEYFL